MICFNCGYKIASNNSKECPLCGMKFPVTCNKCSSLNPLMANFCFNCGNALIKEISQSSIHNYQTLLENRKNVAVMFADVSGFTSLSEKMDPEELRELINDVFNYITGPVYKLEGTIDKYIGDCVMILFGAKYSHSDDPNRAVACGMEMLELINKFSEERLLDKGITLELSIGINYGLVVTGSVGNYFDKDYTVMGDVVNTAQRLQTSAGKGKILVSESVYHETNNDIQYTKPQKISVKNKENPILAYIPMQLKEERETDYLSLVSRDEELNYLHNLYNNSNDTRYLMVTGEGGMGKTSLIKGFTANLDSGTKKIWVNCNPMYQNRVNYVISNILLNLLNLKAEDSNRIKVNRLKSYVDYILKENEYTEEEIEKNYSFISWITGLEHNSDFQKILNAMEYQDIQREIINQLSIFFHNTLKQNDLIFIIDDLHWADSSSLKIIMELINNLQVIRSFFIFTSRYDIEQIPVESPKGYLLELKPLTELGILSLVSKLLLSDSLDKKVLDLTSRYTSGNPLYIKELITSMVRTNKLVIKDGIAYLGEKQTETDLPRTIEGLILANISELDEDTINFLQTASIFGKEFNLSWVNEVQENRVNDTYLKLPLKLNLISLKDVHTAKGTVDKIFNFNQDVIREVLYNSILIKTKQHMHNKIAGLIETKYINDLENYYELLSLHYHLAGMEKKAKDYYYKTAVKYKDNFKYNGALDYFNKYLDTVENNPAGNNDSKYVTALINMGDIYTVLSDHDKVLLYLENALKAAQLSDDIYTIKIMIANVYKEKGLYADALNILDELQPKLRENSNIYGKFLQLKCIILSIIRNSEALELAKKSEEILLRTKDYENLSETMSQAGIIYFSIGEIDNSLYYLNKAYQYAEKINNLRNITRTSMILGIVYHASGMVSKALHFFNKSIELAKKISNIKSYLNGKINLGILYLDKGLFSQAEPLFIDALEIAKEVSSKLDECLVLSNLGDLFYEQDNDKKSLEYYHQSLVIALEHGLPFEEGLNYLGIVKVNLSHNRLDKTPELLDKAYLLFKEANELSYISEYYMLKGLYELMNNNIEKAVGNCYKAVENADKAKSDLKKLKSLRLLGNILSLQGEKEKVLEVYDQSIKLAIQLETDYEAAIGYYHKYLVQQELNLTEATQSQSKAKELINKVDPSRWTPIINN